MTRRDFSIRSTPSLPLPLPLPSLKTFRLAVLVAGTFLCVGCTSGMDGPEGDAGILLTCEGSGDLGVAVGKTGINFDAFGEDDVLATWDRPQGGVGTRINVRFTGIAPSERIDLIQTIIVRPLPGAAGGVGENGGDCSIDANGQPICSADTLSCVVGKCREVITDQVNRQFPLECRDDDSLLVTEMPIRFRTRVALDEIDGSKVELSIRLDIDDDDGEDMVSDPISIQLTVGAFIEPSWWDE